MNTTKPTELITRRRKLLAEYNTLALKAQTTLDIDTAMAAGLAWSEFVSDFLPVEHQDRLEAIKFPRGRNE